MILHSAYHAPFLFPAHNKYFCRLTYHISKENISLPHSAIAACQMELDSHTEKCYRNRPGTHMRADCTTHRGDPQLLDPILPECLVVMDIFL